MGHPGPPGPNKILLIILIILMIIILINAVFDPFDPVWDLPETTFGHLGWCNVVRMVSSDCLYTVPSLFLLIPAPWHHEPLGPNQYSFWLFGPSLEPPFLPFGPSLGPPWDHIWAFRVVQCGRNGQSWLHVYCSNLVPPCSSHFGAPWTTWTQ